MAYLIASVRQEYSGSQIALERLGAGNRRKKKNRNTIYSAKVHGTDGNGLTEQLAVNTTLSRGWTLNKKLKSKGLPRLADATLCNGMVGRGQNDQHPFNVVQTSVCTVYSNGFQPF